MRKLFFILILVFATIACKRSPSLVINSVFGLDLKRASYSVVEYYDVWAMSDGETKIILKIDSLTKKNDIILHNQGAKPLPMPQESVKMFPPWIEKFLSSNKGIYLVEGNPSMMNYAIIVYDEESNRLVYYNVEI